MSTSGMFRVLMILRIIFISFLLVTVLLTIKAKNINNISENWEFFRLVSMIILLFIIAMDFHTLKILSTLKKHHEKVKIVLLNISAIIAALLQSLVVIHISEYREIAALILLAIIIISFLCMIMTFGILANMDTIIVKSTKPFAQPREKKDKH